MPAATGPKRVKNKRIERPFIIGSEAWALDETNRKPETPADHTKGWKVYVRCPDGQPDISRWLKKVQFRIFHTYPNPNRTVETPPFEIQETGWGGFMVELRLHFVSEAGLKAETRQHFLQLEPYGDEDLQAQQKAEKMVRSEFLEFIEFNEPSEALFDTLTDDSQFAVDGKKSGGAAGKGGKSGGAGKRGGVTGSGKGAATGTVELQQTSTVVNPFSKDMEQKLLEMLKRAEAEVDVQLEEEKKRERQVAEDLQNLRNPPPASAAGGAFELERAIDKERGEDAANDTGTGTGTGTDTGESAGSALEGGGGAAATAAASEEALNGTAPATTSATTTPATAASAAG